MKLQQQRQVTARPGKPAATTLFTRVFSAVATPLRTPLATGRALTSSMTRAIPSSSKDCRLAVVCLARSDGCSQYRKRHQKRNCAVWTKLTSLGQGSQQLVVHPLPTRQQQCLLLRRKKNPQQNDTYTHKRSHECIQLVVSTSHAADQSRVTCSLIHSHALQAVNRLCSHHDKRSDM